MAAHGTGAGQVAAWTLQPLFTLGDDSATVELKRVRSVLWTNDARLLIADGGSTHSVV
ncbi:MAG: hypothetical protein ACT4P7_19145 [Gemmatimonadaceae bacterium]